MFNARQQRFRARIAERLEKIEDIMALKEEIREVKKEIKKTSKCGSRLWFGYIYFPETVDYLTKRGFIVSKFSRDEYKIQW